LQSRGESRGFFYAAAIDKMTLMLSFYRGIRHFFTKNVVFVKKIKVRCRYI
jgi:hypothetical protein